jgi:hypothetical protein
VGPVHTLVQKILGYLVDSFESADQQPPRVEISAILRYRSISDIMARNEWTCVPPP